jgi:ATP-binding cassette subfamily B multidrug efflux pump
VIGDKPLQAQTSSQGGPGAAGGRRGRPASNLPKNNGLRRSINRIGGYRRIAILAYGSLFIATLAQLAVPQLIQNILTSVTNGYAAQQILRLPAFAQNAALTLQYPGIPVEQSKATITAQADGAQQAIIIAGLIILGFAITRGVFSFFQSFNSERLSQSVAFDIRNDLFAKIQRLSFSYHDQNQTGQLMIRATDDVEKVRLFLGQGLLTTLQAVILLVGTLIILFATNWRLTLVILPLLPVVVVLFGFFGAIAGPLFGKVQRRLSTLNTVLQENLAGIKVVKAFTREPYEQVRFAESATSLMEQQLVVARVFSILFPVIFLVAQVGQAAILYFGGRQILENTLTLAEYQKFSLYLIYIFLPLGQLGFIINLMSQANASGSRIYEIVDTKNEVENKPNAVELPPVQGHVEFKHVTFKYFGSGDPVLSDVSIDAKPGETIALLGATGSGKTTIINLLPRFYDASSGQIMIDGFDVRDVTLDSLRSQIGTVLQETNLFGGSIRDNIAFGRPDAPIEEVINAAKAAAAHDFITSFPQGYDTPVGERGTTLSGGQKQRIAIARALLLNPRLLILDDSTSAVDMTTEFQIQKALDRLMKGRTSFVIAQRISTVLNADQILVLDKGVIVARGKHEELMENSPDYAEIYNSQLVGDAESAPDPQSIVQTSAQGAK